MIARGEKSIAAVYRGEQAVTAVYRGEQLVWSGDDAGDWQGIKGTATAQTSVKVNGKVIVIPAGDFDIPISEPVTSFQFVDGSRTPISIFRMSVTAWEVRDMTEMFADTLNLIELDLSGIDVSGVTNMDSLFSCSWRIETLNLAGWDMSNADNIWYMFSEMDSLVNIIGPIKGLGKYDNTIDVAWSPLSPESVQVLIDGLYPNTQSWLKSLNVSSECFNRLTQEQIAITTSKGWSITNNG